tara:strand:+ start:180 stop:899 length:720 start_codon:yes stop_codon:yes gene_type:complete
MLEELKNKIKIGIIPARLHSTRLPKKILIDVNGKPMVIRTADQISKCSSLDKIIIAIDDNKTYEALKDFEYELIMTKHHNSGTDRVAEVVKEKYNADIIINIQADEPFINPKIIDKLIGAFKDPNIGMCTLVSSQLSINDLNDESIVKTYLDENLYATDFIRFIHNHSLTKLGGIYKHLGIYGFTKNTLLKFISYKQTINEKSRSLEQMRALDNDIKIKTIITDQDSLSINTKFDLNKI